MTTPNFFIKILILFGLAKATKQIQDFGGTLPKGFVLPKEMKLNNQTKKIKIPKTAFILFPVLAIMIAIPILILTTNTQKDPYHDMTDLQKDIHKNALSYDRVIGGNKNNEAKLAPYKAMVDSSDCRQMLDMYNKNIKWSIRPYIAYRLIQTNCSF